MSRKPDSSDKTFKRSRGPKSTNASLLDPAPSGSSQSRLLGSPSSGVSGPTTRARSFFPTSRQQAQNDPDYSRKAGDSKNQGSTGNLKELFQATLKKKPRNPLQQSSSVGAAATQASNSTQSKPLPLGQPPQTPTKPKEEKVSYNEGYKDRIKSVEDSALFFRMPLDYQPSIDLLQNIYTNISELEASQKSHFDQLKEASTSHFDLAAWSAFNKAQIQLVELYCDFIHYAYSPSERASHTKRLVTKYKIPSRLWNTGILHYVDHLRWLAPHSKAILARFVTHCMSLLMMFTEPTYDSRHVWIESLGDLSMLCLMSSVEAVTDWRDMCMYWYQRRALLTAGTGRLYRHMGTISESKISSLFYACKAMTATQAIEVHPPDLMSILHHAIESGDTTEIESKRLKNEPGAATIYISWHSRMMGFNSEEDLTSDQLQQLLSDFTIGDSFLISRGAMVALCNIAALLGYGKDPNTLLAFMKHKIKSKRPSSSHSGAQGVPSEEFVASPMTEHEQRFLSSVKPVIFKTLGSLVEATDYTSALQHVIVWLHFLLAVASVPESIRKHYIDDNFPMGKLAGFINKLVQFDATGQQYYKDPPMVLYYSPPRLGPRLEPGTCLPEELLQSFIAAPGPEPHPEIEHVPALLDRPLPEEVHIRGFAWSALLPELKYMNRELAPLDEPYVGFYGQAYLTEIRVKRILEFAQSFDKAGIWLSRDSASGYYYPLKESG